MQAGNTKTASELRCQFSVAGHEYNARPRSVYLRDNLARTVSYHIAVDQDDVGNSAPKARDRGRQGVGAFDVEESLQLLLDAVRQVGFVLDDKCFAPARSVWFAIHHWNVHLFPLLLRKPTA